MWRLSITPTRSRPTRQGWFYLMLGAVLVGSFLLFLVAMLVFGRVEGNFAEEL